MNNEMTSQWQALLPLIVAAFCAAIFTFYVYWHKHHKKH